MKKLISKCWSTTPNTRPSFQHILKMLETKIKDEVNVVSTIEEENKKREEEVELRETKELIARCRNDVDQLAAPVSLLRASCLMSMTELQPMELLEESNSRDLVTFENAADLELFLKKNFTIYMSHEWFKSDAIDDRRGTKLKCMQAVTEKLSAAVKTKNTEIPEDEDKATTTRRVKSSLEKTFVFIDYCCVPQDDAHLTAAFTRNIPFLTRRLHNFVMCCPLIDSDIVDRKNEPSYSKRGWPRLEQWGHISRRGCENLYACERAKRMSCENENEEACRASEASEAFEHPQGQPHVIFEHPVGAQHCVK